jgi:hypothetical protein
MKNLHPPKKLIGLLAAACLALACFVLSPQARAVCQEGCDAVNFNTFLGDDALLNNSGVSNTAVGWHALKNNANTSWNTAIGSAALEDNTSGYDNTATGVAALGDNTGGHSNTGTGRDALSFNTTGSDNTATGAEALLRNQTGNFNVADGMWALSGNTTGGKNTAAGYSALASNTTGDKNTATGYLALSRNTTGKNNIALGFVAGVNLTTGNGNIDIGNLGVADESGTIRIGTTGTQSNAYIAGISGVTVPGGVGVIIDTDGHLGTVVSSERFKDAIKPMDKASEAILSLEPVTFRYKKDLDPKGIPQFGLLAEQVEKIDPDLVARDKQGKPYTVRYEAVSAMLLNEFLKEHRKVEEQQATIAEVKSTAVKQATIIAQQQKDIAALTTALKKQAAQIQQVSDQLRTQTPAARVVAND